MAGTISVAPKIYARIVTRRGVDPQAYEEGRIVRRIM